MEDAMANIALTETDPRRARAYPEADRPNHVVAWSPRRRLVFIVSSASGLWLAIGLGLWAVL